MVEKIEKNERKFSKIQILESKKYFKRKDIINVILENDREYTLEEVDKLIENFMRKVVK